MAVASWLLVTQTILVASKRRAQTTQHMMGVVSGGADLTPALEKEEKHVTLYHATTKEEAERIFQDGMFRFPTVPYAQQKGLRLGAGVYFGTDKDYCMREALQTAMNQSELLQVALKPGNRSAAEMHTLRSRLTDSLRLLVVDVVPGFTLSFGDYDACLAGKCTWPLAKDIRYTEGSSLTPSGVASPAWVQKAPLSFPFVPECMLPNDQPCCDCSNSSAVPVNDTGAVIMSGHDWEENTELLTAEYLAKYGFDSAAMNEGTRNYDLAVYRPDQIRAISISTINVTMSCTHCPGYDIFSMETRAESQSIITGPM